MIVFISRRAQPAQGQATSAIRDPIDPVYIDDV